MLVVTTWCCSLHAAFLDPQFYPEVSTRTVMWEPGFNSDLLTPKFTLPSLMLLVGVSTDTIILEANLAKSNKIKGSYSFLTLKLHI